MIKNVVVIFLFLLGIQAKKVC